MKKLLVVLILLFVVNVYAQETTIDLQHPKNNRAFKAKKRINYFSWNLSEEIKSTMAYMVEVVSISTDKNSQKTYTAKTRKNRISARKIFGKEQLDFGHYIWRVTDTNSSLTSRDRFFSIVPCDINFDIVVTEIECLGYDDLGNKNYKICFDSTYQSNSGSLDYTPPGTGLKLLSGLTGTSISPPLTQQTGNPISTISYCFEVATLPGTTAITFGLTGDDINPPFGCTPGAFVVIDTLPSCSCNDCDEKTMEVENLDISQNGTNSNQFNISGNIIASTPVYGFEFQIQSYSYTATPAACTEGIGSIEESGMILMSGTSINGSTSFQLLNETISGSPNSNNNATKTIKYISPVPIVGPIPVQLTIGLPGPIPGLDPSCCEIEYEVCIKIKIFYEESHCKQCTFTRCFKFNNQ